MRLALRVISLVFAVTVAFVWTVGQAGMSSVDKNVCELAHAWFPSIFVNAPQCAAHVWFWSIWEVSLVLAVVFLVCDLLLYLSGLSRPTVGQVKIPQGYQSVSATFFSPFGQYKIGWINVYRRDERGNLSPETIRLISEVSKVIKIRTIIPWLIYRIELAGKECNVHVFFKRSHGHEFSVASFGDMPFA
jgi:hypothetical protein